MKRLLLLFFFHPAFRPGWANFLDAMLATFRDCFKLRRL